MLHSGVDISKLDKETFKYYFILNEVTVNVMCFLLLLVLFVFVVLCFFVVVVFSPSLSMFQPRKTWHKLNWSRNPGMNSIYYLVFIHH